MKNLILVFTFFFTLISVNLMSQTNQTQWEHGTTLTIKAQANPGWYFTNWTENGTPISNDSIYVFTVTGNRNIIANFLPIMLNVSITTPQPIGGTFSGSGTYQWGSNVTIDATPNQGWLFSNWVINGVTVTNQTHNFIITEETTIICVFSRIVYTVTLSALPIEGGIVTGEGVFNYGENVTINAENNSGWTFNKWVNENGDSISQNPHTFTIYNDVYFVGMFNVFLEIPKHEKHITIYPNPSNGKFNIESEDIRKVIIFNMNGSEIYSVSNVNKNNLSVDVTSLPPGVYLVKIVFEKNIVDSKIIIK